jgi:hypothetical protein
MSDTFDDGGQAFPRALALDHNSADVDGLPGMSLRDYFAGQALTGILASLSDPAVSTPSPAATSAWAYKVADAMLRARDMIGQVKGAV